MVLKLMSAKSSEATGVFEAAVKHYQEREKVDLSKDKAFKYAMDMKYQIQMAATARNALMILCKLLVKQRQILENGTQHKVPEQKKLKK